MSPSIPPPPTYFLVRVIPSQAVSPEAFQTALSDLVITAYDLTVSTPDNDRTLGSASGLLSLPGIPLTIYDKPWRLEPAIIQHIQAGPLTPYSVATAVIVIDGLNITAGTEYPTPTSFDVRLQLSQKSGASTPTAVASDQYIDFNTLSATQHYLSNDPFDYTSVSTDIYLTLDVPPSPLPSGVAILSLNRNGSAPQFNTLLSAVDSVLSADVTSGAQSIEKTTTYLSAAQAQQIASELSYNRLLNPPPPAPYPTNSADPSASPVFEDLFTDNSAAGGSAPSDDVNRSREQFQGQRSSYYAQNGSNATRLSAYVYSLVMAVQMEQYIIDQGLQAQISVPIQSTITHTSATTSPTISLAGSVTPPASTPAPLSPPFTVPAAFIYALTTSYALNQDFNSRINVLLTSSSDTLTALMNQAIAQGVTSSPDSNGVVSETTTLNSSGSVTINQYQAIRRFVALQPAASTLSTSTVYPSSNTYIESLMTKWLEYYLTDDEILTSFWTPLFPSKEYLNTILEIVAPNQESLISKAQTNLLTPVGNVIATVNDFLQITEASWLQFFTTYPNLLPAKYLLGNLAARVHSFVVDIGKVLYLAPAVQTAPTYSASGVPYLEGAFDRDVLVQFFESYSGFSLAGTFDSTAKQAVYAAALNLFSDVSVAAFVARAVEELWTLYQLTSFVREYYGTCKLC